MSSINVVAISGNLTRDPELKATAGGSSVLRFSVAVNERRKDPRTGEWGDYPNFVDCAVFGNRADALSRLLAKGSKVSVQGKLSYSAWERDGQKRSKLEVTAHEVELMSQRRDQRQEAPAPYQAPAAPYQAPQQATAVQAPATADLYAADIPF